MILWINGAFGSGKTSIAIELNKKIPHSFIYDAENAGSFLNENLPKTLIKNDFQDIDLWRNINFEMLKKISSEFDGLIIVPMTIVNPQYYKEIITKLREYGIQVKHYVLYASKKTLLKRLEKRNDGNNSWPAQQIDRCLQGLQNEIFENKIDTESKNVNEIVQIILNNEKKGIQL